MFQGTLPHKAIKIIGNIVKEWDCERIYVGCSGNFTIERSISELVDCKITSNDVTIYSSNIGRYFAGIPLDELEVKEDYDGPCNFLREYMNNDTEKVATMILAADILPYAMGDNAYSRRMLRGYKEQYERIHKNLCVKLEALKTQIDTFYHGDVMKMLDEIPSNCGFISFPPFFKGGYEKMWKNIENFFNYTEPEYEMFDPDVHVKAFCEKVSKLDNFCVGTEREVPELEQYFCGTLNTGPNKLIYFYSKTDKKHYVTQGSKKTKAKPIVRIGENDEITGNIVISPITIDQFNEIRALYLSTAVAFMAMLEIVQKHMEELKDCWIDSAKDKEYIPISTIIGRSSIKASDGRIVDKAVERLLSKGEIKKDSKEEAVALLATKYLESEGVMKKKEENKKKK